MRRLLLLLVVLVVVVPQAKAEFHWNQGVVPSAGETLQIDLVDAEVIYDSSGNLRPGGIITELGDELYGIAKVTGITGAVNGTTYWSPSADQEIAMEFSGFVTTNLPAAGGGAADFAFSGGTVKWYFDATPDFNKSTGPLDAGWTSVAVDNGVGNAGDVPWFDTVGVPGRDATYPAATLVARDTQTAVVNGSEIWLTGVGQGLLDITSYHTTPEPFSTNVDMLFDTKFTTHYEDEVTTPGSTVYVPWESLSGWSIDSVDPILTQFVPEPSSLTMLLMAGLFISGWLRRRKA